MTVSKHVLRDEENVKAPALVEGERVTGIWIDMAAKHLLVLDCC
jgi:hypothetical protein